MQKRTREILALLLLAALLVVGVGAMGYYILVGHNWNVAASNIDDSIGQMEGYTVFLYEGTRPSPAERERVSDGQPFLDDQTRGTAVESRRSGGDRAPVDIRDAVSSYRDKGAVVFTVESSAPARYAEPFVVAKGGRRIGLMSATKPLRKTAIRKSIRNLKLQDAGCIVALTDDAALCKPLVRGISIIICDDAEDSSPNGEWRGSTYCVSAPDIGNVGAVIMSPSGVLSCKTIEEL